MAVMTSTFVLEAWSPTEAFQAPEALAVVCTVLRPPLIPISAFASAVPPSVMGEVVVEVGKVGNVTTGASGAVVSGVEVLETCVMVRVAEALSSPAEFRATKVRTLVESEFKFTRAVQ